MPAQRLIDPVTSSQPGSDSRQRPPSTRHYFLWTAVGGLVFVTFLVVWWWSNAGRREIQALPDERRVPLYLRTVENLRNICDPAAARSLREFCHNEAELALRFRECEASQECRELARRHLPQPRR